VADRFDGDKTALADQVEATVSGHGLEIVGWADISAGVDGAGPDAAQMALLEAYVRLAGEAQAGGSLLALIAFPTGDGQGILAPVLVKKSDG